MEERKEEKIIFKLIQRSDADLLQKHILSTHDKYDLTQIYDQSGYSPLHFAAYKNNFRICELLIEHILTEWGTHMLKTVEFKVGEPETNKEAVRKEILRIWINTPNRGEEGFTALHFASFYGNL